MLIKPHFFRVNIEFFLQDLYLISYILIMPRLKNARWTLNTNQSINLKNVSRVNSEFFYRICIFLPQQSYQDLQISVIPMQICQKQLYRSTPPLRYVFVFNMYILVHVCSNTMVGIRNYNDQREIISWLEDHMVISSHLKKTGFL